MAHGIEQAPVRPTMGVVTTDAGIRTGPDAVVSIKKLSALDLVAATAQGTGTGLENALDAGTVGRMALTAVPNRRPVGHALAPEARHVPMAGKTKHGLPLFQHGVMG